MAKLKQSALPLGDPIDPERSHKLLRLVDVVRDPLHGDIRLTGLERCIVDSPEFQRLRWLNQLAMTYISYPGALHTRFLHSLGVLHVVAQMIDTCNQNAINYGELATETDPVPLRLTPYTQLLARLVALTHDMAHVAFGHTFEKEGRLFTVDEWKDPFRAEEKLLGPNTAFSDRIRRFLKDSAGVKEEEADRLRGELLAIHLCKRSEVSKLRYPFIHDLVGNTICADLIDYVQRDMHFCGLTETFGKRFLEYLAVVPVTASAFQKSTGESSTKFTPSIQHREDVFPSNGGSDDPMCRVVLLKYRYNERHEAVVKADVIDEAVDLVRRRLTVAEKLYFHRTKMVASAMLMSAAHSARLTAKEIWDFSDLEVLKYLAGHLNPRASALAKKLLARQLFKPIYRTSYIPRDETTPASRSLWEAHEKFKDPVAREAVTLRLEKYISDYLGDDGLTGTVAISCPDEHMNLKAFDMLVLPHPSADIRRLQESAHRPTKKQIEAILASHEHLWRIEVCVDPAIFSMSNPDELTRRVAGAIQSVIGPKNEISKFSHSDQDLASLEHELVIRQCVAVCGINPETLTVAETKKLQEIQFQRLPPERLTEAIREFLVASGRLPPNV